MGSSGLKDYWVLCVSNAFLFLILEPRDFYFIALFGTVGELTYKLGEERRSCTFSCHRIFRFFYFISLLSLSPFHPCADKCPLYVCMYVRNIGIKVNWLPLSIRMQGTESIGSWAVASCSRCVKEKEYLFTLGHSTAWEGAWIHM